MFFLQVPSRIGICSLLAYEGGERQPGDDLHDAHSRRWSLEELTASNTRLHPSMHPWLRQRAVALYRLSKEQLAVPLQPELDL
jgi:hypothetical protein